MPARRASITQSELTRYAKAMQAARVSNWRLVQRPDGTRELIVGETPEQHDAVSDWDG